MNDFTKDELAHIFELVNNDEDRTVNSSYEKFVNDLEIKIQTMIDNYCDHEWELTFSGSIIKGIYCQKCAIKLKGS